eukprot:3494682-Pyramimonas_sp.AAC.1
MEQAEAEAAAAATRTKLEQEQQRLFDEMLGRTPSKAPPPGGAPADDGSPLSPSRARVPTLTRAGPRGPVRGGSQIRLCLIRATKAGVLGAMLSLTR